MADKITKADLLKRLEQLEAENRSLKIRIRVLEARRADQAPYVRPWVTPNPWWHCGSDSITAPSADTYVVYNDAS